MREPNVTVYFNDGEGALAGANADEAAYWIAEAINAYAEITVMDVLRA